MSARDQCRVAQDRRRCDASGNTPITHSTPAITHATTNTILGKKRNSLNGDLLVLENGPMHRNSAAI